MTYIFHILGSLFTTEPPKDKLSGTTHSAFKTESPIAKGRLVGPIPTLAKEYEVSFEVNPSKNPTEKANVMHMGLGGNNARYGDNTPSVSVVPSKDGPMLQISSAVNGNKDYQHVTAPIPLNQWSKVKVKQNQVDGEHVYTISVNDKEVHKVKNTQPEEFKDLKVYAGNPWTEAQPGKIKNLKIVDKLKPEGTGTFQIFYILMYK